MKIFNIIFVLVLLLCFSSACKKGWLDVTASNEIKAEEQFKTASGYRDALMGVYISMTDPALYAKDMTWNLVDLLSQQYASLSNFALYDQVQQFNYRSTEATPQIDAIWNKAYNSIANINIALDAMETHPDVLVPLEHDLIRGELLGLRAFLHFDLIRLYGHSAYAQRPELKSKATIPYLRTFSKDLTPQLSYQETFSLLEKDIQESLKLLEEDPVFPNPDRGANYYAELNRNGFYNDRQLRMNYYAVKALQARVLSWQGGGKMQQAGEAAEAVIQYAQATLIPPGTDVSGDRVLSSEHLFGLNVMAFADIVNPFLDADQVTDYNALFMINAVAQDVYETEDEYIGLADFRYNTLLSQQTKGSVSIKLLQNGSSRPQNVMPLIRIPEMYYIAAEAYSSGNRSKAIDYLNQVRASRGIISMLPVDLDDIAFDEALLKAYRKEFVSEGQLFFFYKRRGLKHIPGLSDALEANDTIYMLPYPDSETEFGNRVQ